MTTPDLFKVIVLVVVITTVGSTIIYGGSGLSIPTFIVTSPLRARYDTETVFSISATNIGDNSSIHLRLRTGDASEIILNETTLWFSQNEVKTWAVIIDTYRMRHYQQSSVQLRAQHGAVTEVTDIPMNPLSGHIMVQTDKVIYTPRQTVMYRVIALDDDQKFAKWPVTIDIKNPDLIILERRHHSARDVFNGRNFTLPPDATSGTWSITAYYEGTQVRTSKTVHFDVMEYVLPTFKVEVSAEEKVIALSTNWIQIKVKAVYSYGEPVHGTLELRLGVVRITTIALFNTSYTGTLDDEGEWRFNVPVADLRSYSHWFPDGSRLFLSVNVTEAGTGEVGTAVAMDTFFSNPFYRISFSDSKKYFKPGFNYTLVVDVEAANGDPASGIIVFVIIEMRSEDSGLLSSGFSSMMELDENGRLSHVLSIPAETAALRVQVYTVDPRAPDWAQAEFNARKFISPNNQYLHLQYVETGEQRNVMLHYTPLSSTAIGPPPSQDITLLVISRGRVMHTASLHRHFSGVTVYPLTPQLIASVAPSARVVAYFYIWGDNREIVSDSLYIDTPDVCREEMRLERVSGSPLGFLTPDLHLVPKQSVDLDVWGGSHMRVGLLAVDKSVYFLRDERSLTRDKMFGILGEADEGQGIGDGRDTDKIFQFAGLQYMKLTDAYESTLPVVDSRLDISGLNRHFPDLRRGNAGRMRVEGEIDEEQIPLESVRRYFPESWLFHEITLAGNGLRSERITMPDTITNWTFTAVGVGADGGVCMTRPLELTVFKPFFAKVRLPYKAVRLEEVFVNIGIYNHQNFDINVTVRVWGDVGLCFSENAANQQNYRYAALLRAHQTNRQTVRVIPLVAGSVKLFVDVRSNNHLERDIVEKTLYVVAEGRRVEKSITFPLDPSGKYSSHQSPNRNGVQRTNTATVNNLINRKQGRQLTDILLYMPEEVIQGSEQCQISACGDLMGDIISISVLDGDNLFESSVLDAEEAIGNLAPAVHALLYLNESQFMTPDVLVKGQAHVTHGVSRLLTYRKPDGSFSLTPDSPPATWLTALVLKTLCQAEQITYVDHGMLIVQGFAWLLDQIYDNGTLRERDRRLAHPSQDYDLMLSAETLIALCECQRTRPLSYDDLELMGHLELLLGDHVDDISSPLVMAKTAYALTLSDPEGDVTSTAVQRLNSMKRSAIGGLHYWSVSAHENDPPHRPFWYHSGSKASSIEATAYGLLVASHHASAVGQREGSGGAVLDSIAGWLIQKRNSRGAFIGAMDTSAATQALSKYSLSKLGVAEVNLHCNVSTNPTRNYSHAFDFTPDNAITPRSLSNVPVGRQLRVETRGTGLGQMQVRVQYNVPIQANADCRYNVTITARPVSYSLTQTQGDEVCQSCQMGCDDNNNNNNNNNNRRRQKRQISSSLASICIEVCIKSSENMYADRTILDIEMLTGFQPFAQDLERLYDRKERLSLSSLIYVPERSAIEMKFNQIPHDRTTCVSFRATEREPVQRRSPAIVTVRAHEDPEPTCVHTYDPVVSEMRLAVYCANNQTNNQGQCRCFSGLCGQCHTDPSEIHINDVQSWMCQSQFIHKIRQTSSVVSGDWENTIADVISTPKNGTEPVDSQILLVSPRTCSCPHRVGMSAEKYFFGSHVDIFVDRNNQQKKTYLVDQTTRFVSDYGDRVGDFIRYSLADDNCQD